MFATIRHVHLHLAVTSSVLLPLCRHLHRALGVLENMTCDKTISISGNSLLVELIQDGQAAFPYSDQGCAH